MQSRNTLLTPARPLGGMRRSQSLGEEVANAVSHGLGAVAAVAAIPVLLISAIMAERDGATIFAFGVFGVTMLALYVSSTLYHALPLGRVGPGFSRGRAKRVFRLLDHCAIYLLIAGTYSPFALGVFRDSWGWPMFSAIWALAVTGVAMKAFGIGRHPALSAAVYLGMGWCALFALDPLLVELPRAGLWWLIAGGIAYTLGVVPFALDERVRYGHFGWHLFVLTGSACHFVAVLLYA